MTRLFFTSVDYGKGELEREDCRRADATDAQALIAALRDLGGRRVLGIGARVADYVRAVTQAGFEIAVLDRSEERLARVRQLCRTDSICGHPIAPPLRTASCDSALAVGAPVDAGCLDAFLRELRRVVRRGVVLEAVTRENLDTLWYRRYFPGINPAQTSAHQALGTIITAALRAGFGRAKAKPALYSRGGELTAFESARTRPELLFDDRFRASISEFTEMDANAIDQGLRRLRLDLDSGRFDEIRACYESEHAVFGDSFVITIYSV